MAGARSTRKAVAQAASLEDARAAAGSVPAAEGQEVAASGRAGADPLLGDLRRAGLLPLLVLHFLGAGASYGNQLMERVYELTEGLVAVNPNTMYPLLRSLEARGLIRGEWEHPERRSRRFYELTEAGSAERARLAASVEPHLRRVASGVRNIHRELAGQG